MTRQQFFDLLNAELIAGNVPNFNPEDQTEAQAYVDFYNNLAEETVMTLRTVTHYEIELSATPFEGGSEA